MFGIFRRRRSSNATERERRARDPGAVAPALERLYPGRESARWLAPGVAQPGNPWGPLERSFSVLAWDAGSCWVYVTSRHPDARPGHELTFRLTKRPDEAETPHWAYELLGSFADMERGGDVLAPGDTVESGRIAGKPLRLYAFLVAEDPVLGSPRAGADVTFLYVIGVDRGLADRALSEGADAVLAELRARDPELATSQPVDYSDLMKAHRYGEVAAGCEAELRQNPRDEALQGWHAHAMLCLGRLSEALEEYRGIATRTAIPGVVVGDRDRLTIGAIEWMLGRPREALATFRDTAHGIVHHSITHSDLAGGVGPGVLLWYAAVSAGDDEVKRHAIEYLRGRARRKAASYWPGPLARYALREASEEDILNAACRVGDVERATRVAQRDLLARRQLVEAMFCFATRSRERGDEDACALWMKRCATLENPLIEPAWFLADAEVRHACSTSA